ncbi:MAG: hypothetical protein IJA69_01720 [Clostridia bacterium]|nr:hypothetical protein [Clostridia bacterium]
MNKEYNNFFNNIDKNIYPNCKISEFANNINNYNKNNNSPNNSPNYLSNLLPLLLKGENIDISQILKNVMPENPLISTLLGNLGNNEKKQENKNNLLKKIDVSSYNKIT